MNEILLILEDDPESLRVVQRIIRPPGFKVLTARSLAEAQAIVAEEKIAVLVADIGLGDGTSHELMAQLKSRDGTVGLAISGYGMENDIETSLAAGFSEHLVKPVKAPRLREAIAVLIESRA